jgi:prophage tail gpP-like protein
MGDTYEVHRFREYRVDIDLEMDADGFNMILENPSGAYTGPFNKFDEVDLAINNVRVLKGVIDSTEYITDESESVIQVVGRDMCGILVDNDALPGTSYNIKPSDYIARKCTEYGIPNHQLDTSAPVVDKLIIGTQESEISVMNNILMDSRKRLWAIYDTLYMGDWNTAAEPSYYFTRGVPQDQSGIPIKKLSLKDDGTEMKSEVKIYGSMDDGSEKVVGTATNDYMVSQGIKRRRVLRSYNDDSSSKYASNALRDVRESFRSGIILEITIRTKHATVLPNRTALVIDDITKTNSIFFIKSVSYQKNATEGSITVISMIPGDTSFDVIWKNQGNASTGHITGISAMSIDQLLKLRK